MPLRSPFHMGHFARWLIAMASLALLAPEVACSGAVTPSDGAVNDSSDAFDTMPDSGVAVECGVAVTGDPCATAVDFCQRIYQHCPSGSFSQMNCTCGTDRLWTCTVFEPCPDSGLPTADAASE